MIADVLRQQLEYADREIAFLEERLAKLESENITMRTALVLRGIPISVEIRRGNGTHAFKVMANGERLPCQVVDQDHGLLTSITL